MCIRDRIPPEQVGDHKFLKGQNILSKTVSRSMADSLRFQNGFFAPAPGYHDGDVRVPCLLYTSDAADERSSVDLGGRRIINKKKTRDEQ